jgi:hypothetical protein
MHMPMNTISSLILFWCMVYALALLSIYTAGILARYRDAKKAPAKPIRSNRGFRP